MLSPNPYNCLLMTPLKHTYVDQSPIVARRLGFPALPLAVLAALIGSQSVGIVISTHYLFPTTMYGALVERGQWIVLGLIAWVWYVFSFQSPDYC